MPESWRTEGTWGSLQLGLKAGMDWDKSARQGWESGTSTVSALALWAVAPAVNIHANAGALWKRQAQEGAQHTPTANLAVTV